MNHLLRGPNGTLYSPQYVTAVRPQRGPTGPSHARNVSRTDGARPGRRRLAFFFVPGPNQNTLRSKYDNTACFCIISVLEHGSVPAKTIEKRYRTSSVP